MAVETASGDASSVSANPDSLVSRGTSKNPRLVGGFDGLPFGGFEQRGLRARGALRDLRRDLDERVGGFDILDRVELVQPLGQRAGAALVGPQVDDSLFADRPGSDLADDRGRVDAQRAASELEPREHVVGFGHG